MLMSVEPFDGVSPDSVGAGSSVTVTEPPKLSECHIYMIVFSTVTDPPKDSECQSADATLTDNKKNRKIHSIVFLCIRPHLIIMIPIPRNGFW